MNIETVPVTKQSLTGYSTVSIGFELSSKYAVEQVKDGLGFILREEKVEPPYWMDYDVIDEEGPMRWLKRFDTAAWCLFLAHENGKLVGGATVAISTPGVFMLDGREDLAVLWDIRVQPESRHSGIGTQLFTKAARWSKAKECRQLKIETQNVNVPACRFYAKQGCHLGGVNFYHYIKNPLTVNHVMLLWYLEL
jgi:ribosomal protein S18 acetylase RimI-like enzyme